MHYTILDKERLSILPLLEPFKNRFYLAGGTALALHLGHRDSIDFDFFTQDEINTKELFNEIANIFSGYNVIKTQDEKNTLSVIIDNSIKMSFFTYKYEMIEEVIDEPYLRLASITDIACMKFSAVTGRATSKDYIDLYFIFKIMSLGKLLELSMQKFENIDTNLVVKSLVYFDDVEQEPIVFKEGNNVSWQEVKDKMIEVVRELG